MTIDAHRNLTGALAVHGGRLFAAWRTGDPRQLANNARDGWQYAFATGGGLDIMLRTDPQAQSGEAKHKERAPAAPGDARLFITRIGDPVTGRPLAVLFRAGGGAAQVYASPVGEVAFGAVTDVTAQVQFAQRGGDYEISVPLDLLGIKATEGVTTRGDIGVLTGDGADTQARLYWNNKAAVIVSDIPSEARLLPEYWGTLKFEKSP